MPKSKITVKPMTTFSRTAAQLAFVSSAGFMILLAALHVLKPELDPSWHFISEYELGSYGWVMRLAFFALATSCASLGAALLSQLRTVVGYVGLGLLLVSAIGMAIAGTFVTDPIAVQPSDATRAGKLHQFGAMLDLLPFAAILIGLSLARREAWGSVRGILIATAWLPLLGSAVFVASLLIMLPTHGGMLGPEVKLGWPNRILIVSHSGWLMIVAGCALKVAQHRPVKGGVPPLHEARS